jgi:tetratricopeptide (TPR) repeat protein
MAKRAREESGSRKRKGRLARQGELLGEEVIAPPPVDTDGDENPLDPIGPVVHVAAVDALEAIDEESLPPIEAVGPIEDDMPEEPMDHVELVARIEPLDFVDLLPPMEVPQESAAPIHTPTPDPAAAAPPPADRGSSVKFELVTEDAGAGAAAPSVASAATTAPDDLKRDERKRASRGQDEVQPDLTTRDERLSQARELVREGRVHDAIQLYGEVVADNPQSLKARNNLGVLYDELGQHERALEQFEAARAIDGDNVEVLSNIGSALLGLGRFPDAERELRRAMKLDPQNVEVRAHLGVLHFRRGLYAQAEEELRWVCEHDGEHGPAHFYRGESLNRLGRVDLAMEVLERAARLQPTNARIFQLMGILYDKKHMPYEASQMYKKVRELGPRSGR